MEHITREQLLELLRIAKKNRERDFVLILVSFWHGLRASEAIQLTPANFSDGYLNVQRLKGSMRTIQPLVEDPHKLLNERAAVDRWMAKHRKVHNGDGREQLLFPVCRQRFYQLMREYGQLAGLPLHLCHPHILKHSIAMQSIQKAGIENVRQYLGHKSISSTGAYLRVSDDAASRAISTATHADKGHFRRSNPRPSLLKAS